MTLVARPSTAAIALRITEAEQRVSVPYARQKYCQTLEDWEASREERRRAIRMVMLTGMYDDYLAAKHRRAGR